MIHGVTQHVFQRRGHAFQHVAIHLAFSVADDEFHVLAQLAGHLADDAFQTRQHPFERHHARAHQAFLQFGVDAALLLQQVFRVLIGPVEGFLEVEQVGGGFEQGAGQLLQLRVAVHFQRIEFFVAQAFGFDLLTAENPPLGFGIEPAQLIAHTLDGGFHLAQGHAGVVDLLLDTATEDRGFPGEVDQIVQQFCRNLDHVRAGIRCRCFNLNRNGRNDRRFGHRRMAEVLDRIDQPICRRARLPGAGSVEHLRQSVVAALQQREQRRRRLQHTRRQAFVEEFQFMGQIANRGDFHHPRAALQRVQIPQQGFHFLAIRRLGLPAHQRRARVFDDVETFFKEDLQQLRVMPRRIMFVGRFDRFRRAGIALAKGANGFNQFVGIAQRLLALQLFKQHRQAVMAGLQQPRQCFAVAKTAISKPS